MYEYLIDNSISYLRNYCFLFWFALAGSFVYLTLAALHANRTRIKSLRRCVLTHTEKELDHRKLNSGHREFNAREEKRIVTPYFSRIKPCHEHGNSLNAEHSE